MNPLFSDFAYLIPQDSIDAKIYSATSDHYSFALEMKLAANNQTRTDWELHTILDFQNDLKRYSTDYEN